MVDDNQEYFDAIVISEVVEHVNNLDDFLMNSTQLLKVKKLLIALLIVVNSFLNFLKRTVDFHL